MTYPLGRVVRHDPRSLEYPYDTTGLPIVSVKHPRRVPIFDQGKQGPGGSPLGSCTGNAAVGCLGTAPLYGSVKSLGLHFNDALAVSVYSQATRLDEFHGTYPPTDTGSSGVAVAKSLKRRGLIDEYRHTFTFEDALRVLGKKPVITGVNWYADMYEPSPEGIVRPGGRIEGGHEFVVDEIDLARELVGCQNSWGLRWGLRGRFFIPFEDWHSLLHQDGDVTIFMPITPNASTDWFTRMKAACVQGENSAYAWAQRATRRKH